MKGKLLKVVSLFTCIMIVFQSLAYAIDVVIEDPTPDLEGPILNNIYVSSNKLTPTAPVKVIADISDELSGFKSGSITYKKPNNQTININLVLNSTSGKYEANIEIPESEVLGEWILTTVYLQDNKDNEVYLKHTTTQTNGETVDFSELNLTVDGVTPPPTPTDFVAPILHNVSVSSQQVKVNEKIQLTANVTDNESGVNYLEAIYQKPSGNTTAIPFYKNAPDQYIGNHTIGKYEESGEWVLKSINLVDNAGNYTTIKSYTDTENNYKSFENCNVLVSGTTIDDEAPILHSVSVKTRQVKANEKVEVHADITDNESGVSSAYVYYKKPNGNYEPIYLYKNSTGQFVGSVYVSQYEERGEWVLTNISLSDAVGNTTNLTTYIDSENHEKSFDDCTVEITGTTPDWEGPELYKRQISVQQISPSQAAVKLTVEARDNLSGLNHSSLTGVYRKPSGKLVHLDFEKRENIYTATINIDKYDELGKWTLERLSIMDALGNINLPNNRSQDSTFAEFDLFVSGKITITPGSPESIKLDSPKSMKTGETYQLKPILSYSNPTKSDKDITNDPITKYSTSNPNLLTIDSNGLLTVPNTEESGNVFVEVSYGDIKEQIEITVNEGQIKPSLQVEPLYTTLHAGQSVQLKVVEINDGARKDVTNSSSGIIYSSSNPSLVTVSKDGYIQAINGDSTGLAVINFEYKNLVGSTTVKVTKPTVLSLAVSPAEENLSLTNNKLQLYVKAYMSDGTTRDVTEASEGTKYTSSNPNIVQVSSDGFLTVPPTAKSGEVTINSSYGGVIVKSVLHVTGNPELVSVDLESIPKEMSLSEQVQISLKSVWSDGTVMNINFQDVTFVSSRPDRVSLSPEGVMQAISTGTSNIEIKYQGKTFQKSVSVLPPPYIINFMMKTPISSEMNIGDKVYISDLIAEWSDGSLSTVEIDVVTISSSRPDRVSVLDNGLLQAEASGSSNIEIKYQGKIINFSITVEAGATLSSIYLVTTPPATMKIGDEYTIGELRAKWSNGDDTLVNISDISYSSSRVDRVSVTVDGKIKALTSGTSYIYIDYQGKRITATIKVESAPILSSIYLEKTPPATMKIGAEYYIGTVKAKWSNGEITTIENSDIVFTSSRQDRISVNEFGLLKALNVGTSNIEIKYGGNIIFVSVKGVY